MPTDPVCVRVIVDGRFIVSTAADSTSSVENVNVWWLMSAPKSDAAWRSNVVFVEVVTVDIGTAVKGSSANGSSLS